RGNLTGVSFLNTDLGLKRMGLLHEMVPKGTALAVLVDQNFPDAVSQLPSVQEAARSLGREAIVLNVRNASDIDRAFATLEQQASAFLSLGGNFLNTQRGKL